MTERTIWSYHEKWMGGSCIMSHLLNASNQLSYILVEAASLLDLTYQAQESRAGISFQEFGRKRPHELGQLQLGNTHWPTSINLGLESARSYDMFLGNEWSVGRVEISLNHENDRRATNAFLSYLVSRTNLVAIFSVSLVSCQTHFIPQAFLHTSPEEIVEA